MIIIYLCHSDYYFTNVLLWHTCTNIIFLNSVKYNVLTEMLVNHSLRIGYVKRKKFIFLIHMFS